MASNKFEETLGTKPFVSNELKEKIINLVEPKYKECLKDRFNKVENSKNAEEALKNAVEEISLLVESEIMTVNGQYYTSKGFLNTKGLMRKKIKKDVSHNIEGQMRWGEMSTKQKRNYLKLTLGSTENMRIIFGDENIEKALNTTAEIMFDLSDNISKRREKEKLDKKLNT